MDCCKVLGIGVADKVKTSKECLIFNSLFLCETPNLCSSSTMIRLRLFLGILSFNIACVPIKISTCLSRIFKEIKSLFFLETKREIISTFIPKFSNLPLNEM